VKPEYTIQSGLALMMWICVACTHEWPIADRERELPERRARGVDRRRATRSDRRKRSRVD
jgi:hypothetical protein